MSKEKSGTGIGVGSSSILVVFVVLCLTAFATLSLVSANSDYKLTKKSATAVQEYYVADCLAEERLVVLATTVKAAAPEALQAELTGAGFPCTTTNGRLLASYEIPINQTKTLYVQIDPLTLERLCWQVRPIAAEETPEAGGDAHISNLPF